MKGKSYPNIKHNEWVYPTMKKYHFSCCDCGLVHEMDFEVIVVAPTGRKSRRGIDLIYVAPLKNKDIIVRLRARRDERDTNKRRKERNIKFTYSGPTKRGINNGPIL